MEKGSESFTLVAAVLRIAAGNERRSQPFSRDVPENCSEKSVFWATVRVTTSAPYKLPSSVPVNVPFTGASVPCT
jgi:hypothetical protein